MKTIDAINPGIYRILEEYAAFELEINKYTSQLWQPYLPAKASAANRSIVGNPSKALFYHDCTDLILLIVFSVRKWAS